MWVKDEARNPTGSFKARGMALAVSMAKHLGARSSAAPSAGNAAGALAAYGARAGLPVTVAMPEDTPSPSSTNARCTAPPIHRVQGTIADAGKFLREHGPKDAFDVSTLREPYRIEGKKTMAYELVEQLGGEVPDVVLYPDRRRHRPRRHVEGVRRDGTRSAGFRAASAHASCPCRPPVARRLRRRSTRAPSAPSRGRTRRRAPTVCGCLSPLGGFLCVRALRETHGTAVAIEEEEMQRATLDLAARSGIDVCPEGGAAWAALAQLRESGFVRPADRVIVFNTGTGLKYR